MWETKYFRNTVYRLISKINEYAFILPWYLDTDADSLFIERSPTRFTMLCWKKSFIKKSRISGGCVGERKPEATPGHTVQMEILCKIYRHEDIKFLILTTRDGLCFLTILFSRPANCCLLKNTKQMFFFSIQLS